MLHRRATSTLKDALQRQARTAACSVTRRSFASASSELGPNFNLSDEQQAFQDLARQFTAEQITPVAAEHDRSMKVSCVCP